jgi:hypothetical protein
VRDSVSDCVCGIALSAGATYQSVVDDFFTLVFPLPVLEEAFLKLKPLLGGLASVIDCQLVPLVTVVNLSHDSRELPRDLVIHGCYKTQGQNSHEEASKFT